MNTADPMYAVNGPTTPIGFVLGILFLLTGIAVLAFAARAGGALRASVQKLRLLGFDRGEALLAALRTVVLGSLLATARRGLLRLVYHYGFEPTNWLRMPRHQVRVHRDVQTRVSRLRPANLS